MTKNAIRERVNHHLTEFFDSYVVVAKVAGEGKFVVMHHPCQQCQEKQAADAGLVHCLYDVADTIAGPMPRRN